MLGRKENKTPLLGENERTEVVAKKDFNGYGAIIHDRQVPDAVARFAMELLRVHAGITARPDGEDSAGRQRGRREEPPEAVKYCCDVAEQAFAAFKDRGWLIAVPSYEDSKAAARDEN